MSLTPLDIQKKTFNRGIRGYDPTEVEAFLTMLSKEWEQLLHQQEELERRIQDLSDTIKKSQRSVSLPKTLSDHALVRKQTHELFEMRKEMILELESVLDHMQVTVRTFADHQGVFSEFPEVEMEFESAEGVEVEPLIESVTAPEFESEFAPDSEPVFMQETEPVLRQDSEPKPAQKGHNPIQKPRYSAIDDILDSLDL